MIEASVGFLGGLFFAAAFPQPSAALRAGVASVVRALRARTGW